MAEPSVKSYKLQEFLDGISKDSFGLSRTTAIKANICIACIKPAVEFKDEISIKEYSISGLCQVCQDKTFGDDI